MPRLLAFIPHPDDESYSFGGTLALAARAGWECRIVCASSGEKGKRHDGGKTDRESVASARELELAASCETLTIPPPAFWRLPDGGLRSVRVGPEFAESELTKFKPDVVLTLGPDGAYGHPDHIALHRWVAHAWQASNRACALLFPVFPPGLFLPQYEKCIGMMGDPPNPSRDAIGGNVWDYAVSIREVRDQKLAAVASHRSQLPGGHPEALFPPGIITALLDVERFEDAAGGAQPEVSVLLASVSTLPEDQASPPARPSQHSQERRQ